MTMNFEVLRKVKGNPSSEVEPGRRLKLNPGQDYQYDMPKELLAVVAENFTPESLKKPAGVEEEQFLSDLGQRFMDFLILKADSDEYRDRTAEMIEIISNQTGVKFPHYFERYMELGILSLRPRDTWTVTEATIRALKLRSYSCTLSKLFAEQGIKDCTTFCRAQAGAAAQKSGVEISFSVEKDLAKDGLCELKCEVKKE